MKQASGRSLAFLTFYSQQNWDSVGSLASVTGSVTALAEPPRLILEIKKDNSITTFATIIIDFSQNDLLNENLIEETKWSTGYVNKFMIIALEALF